MNRDELEEWEQDHKDNQLSSGAYILYLRLYITELESKTCKNCKYSGLYTMGYMPCMNDNVKDLLNDGKVIDDFGCNKWEANYEA